MRAGEGCASLTPQQLQSLNKELGEVAPVAEALAHLSATQLEVGPPYALSLREHPKPLGPRRRWRRPSLTRPMARQQEVGDPIP